MDIFTYIASNNPYQAKAILHKYGYSIKDVRDAKDLGACLKQLVAYEGEDAMQDILENHPDKGIIVEKFCAEEKKSKEEHKNCDGNCSCKRDMHYMNFNGSGSHGVGSKDVGIYILVASLLLATAIISKK
jgi:hypothetical protein